MRYDSQKILVTGATGFVGRVLVSRLSEESKVELYVIVRKRSDELPVNVKQIIVNDISDFNFRESAMVSCDIVIHLAARAHMRGRATRDAVAEFNKENVDSTIGLARDAVKAGVKRFIFLSSIGIHGVETHGAPFSEMSAVSPSTAYALSKWEAEEKLRELAQVSGLEVVVIRPPLVYGANAPGNFGRLLKLISTSYILPFASIQNKRSFIAVENLVNFIQACLFDARAANETFLVADGIDISTTVLVNLLAEGMEKKLLLVKAPRSALRLGARLTGQSHVYTQLFGSLQVNIAKAKEVLDWSPLVDPHQALVAVAKRYLLDKKH